MSGDFEPAVAFLATVNGMVLADIKNAEVKLFLISLLRFLVSDFVLFVFTLHQCFFYLSTDGCFQSFFLQGATFIVRGG